MNFPDLSETMFAARGIALSEREDFLNPDYTKLHDPLLLPDMEKARDRVVEAIERKEHITVYADYDADGIPGAAVLADFFRRIGYTHVSFYIPHRHDEGFGLNADAVDEIAERGTKLLITVDCGIADVEEVARANEKGIDVIITDHHEPGEVIPPAFAIVDPKLEGLEYPFKELCGAALAYKLVLAVLARDRFGLKEGMEKWSLDLVGIATLSDMVPLVGENRILAKFGLDVLRKSKRPGLAALLEVTRVNQAHLTEDDIAFMITPRINAASRMGVPMDAFNLLSTANPYEAQKLALHLEKINQERKGIVASLVRDAKAHLEQRGELKPVIVVGNPDWRPALLGLVANSLVEAYTRPVFVWGRDGDGAIKGSCRSEGTNLFALMSAAADSFTQFGGHAGAGGFAVETEKVHLLEDALSAAHLAIRSAAEDVSDDSKEEEHLSIALQEICGDLWEAVSVFAPFGTGNLKPTFKISQAKVKTVRQFGKTKEHLEVLFDCPRGEVKAISFFTKPDAYAAPLAAGSTVTLLANLEKSYFMNRPELRLRIVDIIEA